MYTLKKARNQFLAMFLATNDNAKPISFFDVKLMYNRAYEEKAKARNALKAFKKILKEAEALDRAYRQQLQTQNTGRYQQKVS